MRHIINRIKWPEQWLRRKEVFRSRLTYSNRDFIISMGLYLIAVVLCLGLQNFDPENDTSYVAMIFLLDVFLTALWTDGYFFSLLMAVFCVLSVDYIFTPPYWQISFTLAGFPLTFLVMMIITILTGAVTSRAKETETARHEVENERVHANLLRSVSHDIRTPLTGIMGSASVLMEQEEISPEQWKVLGKGIYDESQWLLRTVENLLSVTRMGTDGAEQLKMVPTVLEEVIEGATARLHRRYPDVQVSVKLPDEVVLANVDPLLMVQVLLNLMENAVVHGKTTQKILVTLLCDQSHAMIRVDDDGEGMLPEQWKTLFKPLAHSTAGDSKRNMGLGLSVCKSILDAHKGEISAEKSPLGGAAFIIKLPKEDIDYEGEG